jgi:hypothetical protein
MAARNSSRSGGTGGSCPKLFHARRVVQVNRRQAPELDSPVKLYRQKVTTLAQALEYPETRTEATEALRGLIDAIVITPAEGTLRIELNGNLAAMLGATVQSERSPETGDLSLQVAMVAGAGFEPATFGL